MVKRTGLPRVLIALAGRLRMRRHGVIYAGCGVVLAMLALCGYALYQSREDARARALDSSRDVATITERDIARNFELYALSLEAVADGLARPGVLDSPRLRREILFDRAATGQYVGAMVVIDAQGNVVMNSESDVPHGGNLADRPYFRIHRDNAQLGLDVSAPYDSRLRPGSRSVALSRRLSRLDGSFAGIVALGVDQEYFASLFADLRIGQHGSVSIIRTDGTIIVRRPDDREVTGRNIGGTAFFQQLVAQDEGSFVADSPLDGVERLYSFRRIPQLPLIVLVAESTADIYASWWRRALTIGSLMLIFGIGVVVLSAWLGAELRRRQRVERELERLAGTDGLTGLHNRRALCETLDREWLRARRTGSVLSLLFVDIDHFKAYNDTYGHQAGDAALTAVASCIRTVIQRPGDCVGRYGGEEFIVVLPDTDAAGATVVAENMRAAIGGLGIAHRGCEFGRVTVSIGATTWRPDLETDVSVVIRAADEALYSAKAGGRNRVAQVGMG
ncbi:sensor domain-containing diguanylate cyclase [Paraburkholderia antibiotica]|uniref:diguanylate cyclase n=1 Tax=Paraburkholderia antibiotica TaxID=2728839 RepID=A0A7X9X9H7_9BURK|nr:sensor domain-containing diguanylate cyclase [Paraburkholderia antibiotica]NML33469.1 GGDEF domain-containing protein [Paraburkholderia antibiotica]